MRSLHLYFSKPHRCQNNSGIALVLVISVLAVMVSLVVAFLLASRLATIKSFHFKEGMKASSIADAGIEHAKALLHEDKLANGFDDYSENWHTAFSGSDVDNDGDGAAEAKWIEVVDANGTAYGRYAVTVTDEASRININTAGFHNEDPLKRTEGYSPFEVSLNKFFANVGLSSPVAARDALLAYRYGGNVPGAAGDDNNDNGVLAYDGNDNDADGDIDELAEGIDDPAEFIPEYPYGDDQPFLTIDHIKAVSALKSQFNKIRPYITAYSTDNNMSSDGRLRLDLNEASGMDLVSLISERIPTTSCEQAIVNLLDYRDRDHRQSILFTSKGTFYGVEGVRINELLIHPVYSFNAADHTNITGPGGGWVKSEGYFSNAAPEVAGLGGIWWFDGILPGRYYLRVFAASAGQTVGDVKVGVKTHVSMQHGDMFVEPITVGSDGKLKLTLFNAEVDQPGFTTYFAGFELSQQPDAEYIELINVTDNPIDLSGWTLDGLRENDLIAIIPQGTVLPSFDYVVLAVDKNDQTPGASPNLLNNGIAFSSVWDHSEVNLAKVVQLEFSEAIDRSADVLQDNPGTFHTIVYLKDADGHIVDRVKYRASDALEYRAAERGDPSESTSSDSSHIFDQWNASDGFDGFLPQGTPTAFNNNIQSVGHVLGGIDSEVRIKNNALATVGELGSITYQGSPWSHTPDHLLEQFADYICVAAERLEAEGHITSAGSWQEEAQASPLTAHYASTQAGDEAIWLFDRNDRLDNGFYFLNIYGNPGEALSISLRKQDGTWTDFSPPLSPDEQGVIRYGIIDIGGTTDLATPERHLEIKIQNASSTGNAAFDYLTLSPKHKTMGRINLNTAPREVLKALPGVTDDVADRILTADERPFGDIYGLGDMLHEFLWGETDGDRVELFRLMGNMITVKSDVFEIIVTGEAFGTNGKTVASKKVRIVVER